jgi:hypothetical protein
VRVSLSFVLSSALLCAVCCVWSQARDRVACPAAAPAHGLYLSRVDYDDDMHTTSQGTGGAQGGGGGKGLEWPNQPPSGM